MVIDFSANDFAHGLPLEPLLAAAVFAVLAWAVMRSSVGRAAVAGAAPQTTMRDIGNSLMQRYVLPLEVIALMLTAAMIGAVILAVRETRSGAELTRLAS